MTRPSLLQHLRTLASHSAVYGAADVFTNLVNFLLVPLYTTFLTASDYGVLALLILFGTVAKIVFRMGLDAGFFRVHYDLPNEAERRRLAGTVAVFAAGAGGLLFLGVVLAAPALTQVLFRSDPPPSSWVTLVAADVFLGCLAFVPLNLLRIQGRPGLFSAFSMGRHTFNIALKVVLVMTGWGVAGVLWSDAIATGLLSLSLLPVLLRHASLAFSPALLKEALGFGLPKVPHGILVQALNLADRKILDLFVTRAEVGLYQMGYTFGMGVKFALSAFEPAWQPFVYSQVGRPDARETFARVVTYAGGAFLGVGLAVAVLGRDLLFLMAHPSFHAAGPVIPVVALAYVLHGAFLLTSIGIGIERKARYYPLITAAAAGANIGANLLLIPRWGMMGAAWATVVSYGVMAGLGFAISRRLYPIPFEAGRLGRLGAAAVVVYALSLLAPRALWPAVAFKSLILLAFPVLFLAFGLRRGSPGPSAASR